MVFLTMAVTLVLVQTVVLCFTLNHLAADLPNDGGLLESRFPSIVFTSFLITLGVTVPLSLGIGILAIFKVIGPLYRFRDFLRRVANGEKPGPCKIRGDDELQEFCELLNEATAPLREVGETPQPAPTGEKKPARDAQEVAEVTS